MDNHKHIDTICLECDYIFCTICDDNELTDCQRFQKLGGLICAYCQAGHAKKCQACFSALHID